MVQVFVTGGSGFIGGVVVEMLAQLHDVRAMARSSESVRVVAERGATPVECSLERVGAEHVEGSYAVVHCAAHVAEWASDEEYRRVNVDGTARMLAVARAAGVRRFVHLSSDSVLVTGRPRVDIDETVPIPGSLSHGYAATKAESERLVIAANDPAAGFETVVIRPVLVWGPGDRLIRPTLVDMVEQRTFVWLSGGRVPVSTSHVRNVAHATCLALENATGGEVYFITDGEPQEVRAFFTAYAATVGVVLPDRSIPVGVARAAARAVEGLWRIARPRSQPPVTRAAVDTIAGPVSVRSDKAHRDLGYVPLMTVAEGMAELA